ncbi:MAG: MFS transporter [Planctomycetaceae bacterium]|nr:MFS transporter [Planctomycetaceae bacterium]
MTSSGDSIKPNPFDEDVRSNLPDSESFVRQQVKTIGTMYAAYATSMILRMIPTVAGTSIINDEALGIDLDQWGKVLSAGTCGALSGKFICGWAADRFGGRRTFAIALFIASVFVGLFAMSSTLLLFQATFFVTLMAQAAGWPSMTRVILNWVPPRQYGRVWGILSTSSRVGTLTATFVLGSTLTFLSWRQMLWIASGIGLLTACFYAFAMKDKPTTPLPTDDEDSKSGEENPRNANHPFDGLTLLQALPRFAGSLRFWLICGSLMGLTILWDFLLVVPVYMQDTLGLNEASASRAASAFPFGSLISVLIGGFVFDKLDRTSMAWVMAGLLVTATGCLLAFTWLPQLGLSGSAATLTVLVLLFMFGLCVSPCYYIPCSVFSIDFGGPHSGFLVAILDAVGFAATAVFYYFGGGIAQRLGWNAFLFVLVGVCVWSLMTTFFFMRREARAKKSGAVSRC